MEKYTIDELLDVLQWARDRAAYFRAVSKGFPLKKPYSMNIF